MSHVFGWYQQWYHSNRYQAQYLLTRPFLSQPVALCQHTEETHQPLLKVLCNCTLHAEMIMGLTMHMMMQITQAQNRLQSLYLSQEHHFSTPLAYPLPIMSLLYCDMLYSNHPQLYLFYPKLQTMVRGSLGVSAFMSGGSTRPKMSLAVEITYMSFFSQSLYILLSPPM